MKKVYVVDNGGQWTHRIWRVLRELDCESKIIQNTTPLEKIDADALVLSGGAARIAWESLKLGNCTDYLAKFNGPILGVCVGHQLIGVYYGGKAGPAELPEFGLCKIKVIEPNDLFKGLPTEFQVWQSHNDEVTSVPGFAILAESASCRNQAMKHKSKPHYGIQFHPEVNDTEHGEEIYRNFVNLIK
ncbi:MAG: GMP synthase subunit A [Planctomycetes bacterium]|nr:GMP synthase subunit A [Planctomycetota bacterium]